MENYYNEVPLDMKFDIKLYLIIEYKNINYFNINFCRSNVASLLTKLISVFIILFSEICCVCLKLENYKSCWFVNIF